MKQRSCNDTMNPLCHVATVIQNKWPNCSGSGVLHADSCN